MWRFCQKNQGAISVFLTLLLLPTLVFGGVIIDGSRIFAAHTIASGAGDLALNGALTEYDSILKDVYGLMAMSETDAELASNVEDYFNRSIGGTMDKNSGAVTFVQLDAAGNISFKDVANTEVCQPYVEKQQLLEYMKYRAPVAIGDGLIEKFGKMKNIDKQKKALDKQLEFGEELEDLEDACSKLKKALDDHQEWNKDFPSRNDMQGELDTVEKDYNDIAKLLIMQSALDNYKGKVSSAGETVDDKILRAMRAFNTAAKKLKVDANDQLSNYDLLISCMNHIATVDAYISADGTVNCETDEDIDTVNDYNKNMSTYENRKQNPLKVANQMVAVIRSELVQRLGEAKLGKSSANVAKIKADELKVILYGSDGNGGVNKKAQEWKTAIDDLDDGDQKEQMLNNYNKYKAILEGDDISESAIDTLIKKLEDNIEYYSNVIISLQALKFCDIGLADGTYSATSFLEKAIPYTEGGTLTSAGVADAGSFMRENWFEKPTIATDVDREAFIADAFYEKLKKIEAEKQEKEDSQESKEAKDKMNKNLDEGQQGREKAGKEDESLTDADWEAWGDKLPSKFLSQSAALEAEQMNSVDGSANSGSKRKEVSKTSRNSMDETMKMWGNLGDFVKTRLEELYIVEYNMQMFSYYTTKVVAEKKNETAKTLSGIPLSASNNEMYRSEVEYVLWGNEKAATNVVYTSTAIFGTRFLFNSIFAFSDREINNQTLSLASLIAGWTGFGVPLVQNVLKLALALAESANDLSRLLNGEDVAFYKSDETWKMSVDGVLTEGSSEEDSGITFNYGEYLRVYLMISMMAGNEDAILARTADCIQLNIKKQGSDTYLCEASTMGALTADIKVNTTFLNRVPKIISGLSDIDSQVPIKYKSVLAY